MESMKLQIANNSIVFLGENINPPSLNDEFLKVKGVITDWELIEPPISTPLLAHSNITVVLCFYVNHEKYKYKMRIHLKA